MVAGGKWNILDASCWSSTAPAFYVKPIKAIAQPMIALLETRQRPTDMGRAVHYDGDRMPSGGLGFWVQIQVDFFYWKGSNMLCEVSGGVCIDLSGAFAGMSDPRIAALRVQCDAHRL
jgi:hypothetical protein